MTALAIGMFIIGGLTGFILAAALTCGKVTDLEREVWSLRRRLYHLYEDESQA